MQWRDIDRVETWVIPTSQDYSFSAMKHMHPWFFSGFVYISFENWLQGKPVLEKENQQGSRAKHHGHCLYSLLTSANKALNIFLYLMFPKTLLGARSLNSKDLPVSFWIWLHLFDPLKSSYYLDFSIIFYFSSTLHSSSPTLLSYTHSTLWTFDFSDELW